MKTSDLFKKKLLMFYINVIYGIYCALLKIIPTTIYFFTSSKSPTNAKDVYISYKINIHY